MDDKTRELIGIAVSIAGHCRPCFQYHFKQAKAMSISMKDVEETIEFVKNIGEAGNKGMYEWVQRQVKK